MRREESGMDPSSSHAGLNFSQAGLQFTQAAGHVEASAVLQQDGALAWADRLDLTNSGEIHNVRAADAHESGGSKPGLHGAGGFPHNVPFFAGMEHDVIARRFDVVDFFG